MSTTQPNQALKANGRTASPLVIRWQFQRSNIPFTLNLGSPAAVTQLGRTATRRR